MLQRLKHVLARPEIYLFFSRVIGGRSAYPTFIRDHIRPKPGDKLLDIGCGPARVLEFLKDVEYTGFDLSEHYIRAATQRYGSRGRFYCRRVSREAWKGGGEFDLALASGVVHHLPDDEAVSLFDLAKTALKPGGRLITLDGCYVEGQSRAARYLLSRDRGAHVRTEPEYLKLARQVFPHVKAAVRHDLLRIPYTHLILECST